MSIRLNKLLAQRGVGARRKCDLLIQQGKVRVNGRVELEPGTQVEPGRDRVVVDGRPLAGAAKLCYYVLNKPVGVITTLDDPEGRRTIREFLPPGPRLFPVGRLDADTSGLLILTNDGELAHRLMHPRYGVFKTYRVHLERAPGPEAQRRLQDGVEFEPGVRSSPARVRVLSDEEGDAMIQVQLHEGRYRQVRRMCEAVGLRVRALHRSAYGPLRLGPVQRGVWRELSDDEVRQLRAASARPQPRSRPGYSSPRSLGGARDRLKRRLESMGAGEERTPGPERPVRAERPSRPARPFHRVRPGRPEPPVRAERPGRPERPVRAERPLRHERLVHVERGSRPERSPRFERSPGRERPVRVERGSRPERPVRAERGPRSDRSFRPERPVRVERGSRPERPVRAERGPRSDRSFRPERPVRVERGSRPERPVRAERGPRSDRSFRPERPSRPERSPRFERSPRRERPARSERPFRSGAASRPERPVRSGGRPARSPGRDDVRRGARSQPGRGQGQRPRRTGRGNAGGRPGAGPGPRGRR